MSETPNLEQCDSVKLLRSYASNKRKAANAYHAAVVRYQKLALSAELDAARWDADADLLEAAQKAQGI